MEFDFNRYIEDFNRNDDEATVPKYFTEDMILEGPDRTMHGRQAWLDILKFAHAGVKEKLQPVMVVREGNKMMAEVNALFTPSIDRPDFPFVALKAGQPITMKYFASYRLRGHQIEHLTLACWLPSMRSV
jgi:SnoaL-like domain